MKFCNTCGIELTDETWYLSYKKAHSNICKNCSKVYQKTWRNSPAYGLKYFRNKNKKYYEEHKESEILRKKEEGIKLKNKVIQYYSNNTMKCSCCGEFHIEFLSIDHINGGGNKHRKKLKLSGRQFYRWLIKNNFPEGYRVLCHNCNLSFGFFGYCPHQNTIK